MLSLNTSPDRVEEDVDVFDLSQLNAGDDFVQVDTGVTSGADSTSWDEIVVDRDGRVDACEDQSNGQPTNKPGAAVCRDTQPSNNNPSKN